MDIHKVACVGAGLIGQGWATLFSSKGLEVVLQDVSETVLEKAMRGIRSNSHVSGGKSPSRTRVEQRPP